MYRAFYSSFNKMGYNDRNLIYINTRYLGVQLDWKVPYVLAHENLHLIDYLGELWPNLDENMPTGNPPLHDLDEEYIINLAELCADADPAAY